MAAKRSNNFKAIDQLYNYEAENDTPAEERLTEWHNEIDIAVPTAEELDFAADEIIKTVKMLR